MYIHMQEPHAKPTLTVHSCTIRNGLLEGLPV